MRKTILLSVLCSVAALSQTFEVASIRVAQPLTPEAILGGKMNVGVKTDASRVSYNFLSLRELIPIAYDVKPFQVAGPDWLGQQRFDITATLPENATKEQIPAMLRALLEERFKLKAHRD